ncbi:MAG: FAD-dependent oxidoreductase [Parvularculaceae bacterium]|nr:FAD-dependent oxidoreductase [Parvularculaceae bacterium]
MLTRRESLAAMTATLAAPSVSARTIYDVAVIGAGVFGAWTAERLKSAGAAVALVDAAGPAHARASSAGETRVTRISYGGDPLYSPMARESLAAWAALSASASTPLFYRTGVLWFSPANDAYMAKSLAYLSAHSIAHRAMDARALGAAYPQMRFAEGEAGFVETETGALVAGRAVQTLVARSGVPFVLAQAGPPVRRRGAYDVAPSLRAKTLVYAAGPWLPKLFPAILADRIVSTRQEVLHFGPKPGDLRFEAGALPVWADFNAGDIVYGIPSIEGQGFKIAFDRHGPVVDPDTQDRRVAPETVDAARAYLRRRFPDLADAPVVHSRVCQYENSSNGDFLIDRHPAHPDVWLVGGGSGHGFKHGPAVGRLVADHVLDPGKPVEPRFALASKQKVSKRTVY